MGMSCVPNSSEYRGATCFAYARHCNLFEVLLGRPSLARGRRLRPNDNTIRGRGVVLSCENAVRVGVQIK